jgi:hypothetical protein
MTIITTEEQQAAAEEQVIDLDPKADAELIQEIKDYNDLKDAETELDAAIEASKARIGKLFEQAGISGKGEVRLNGKRLLSRSVSQRTTFDPVILYRLAPTAAKRAEKVGRAFFMYLRGPA